MNQAGRVLKSLFSRKWILATVAVIVGMIVLARLGFWQLDRLDQRREKNAALVAALAAEPIDLNRANLPPGLTPLKDRDAIAQGEFDFANQGIVKLQMYQGRPGVNLVAPLVLEGGDTAVLVDRGWVPEETSTDNWAAYDEPGLLTVEGYLALTQTINRQGVAGAVANELAWYRVDIEAIQAQMPYDLLPVFLKQAPGEYNVKTPLRTERDVDLSDGPHLGYAVQWFLFSAILGVVYMALVNKDLQKK